MKLNRFAFFAIMLAVACCFPLAAATKTTNLGVSASVTNNCALDVTNVAFGAYDPVDANASAANALTATGAVKAACTLGASFNLRLGQGSNADAGSTDALPQRRMITGVEGSYSYLAYSLFSDSERTTVWGNTSGTGVGDIGTGAEASFTVYGAVPGAQNVPAGNYADTVVVTAEF